MATDDGRVVSNFITQALDGKDITIYGDGYQTRSFQYIDDLVNGLILMMESDETGPINFGNPDEFTMLELANKILTMVESESKIVFRPLPSDDPKQRKPNITKATNKFDWKPTISLDVGLEKTISYFKNK
jgi:UDP-glucuronate decarboxylase